MPVAMAVLAVLMYLALAVYLPSVKAGVSKRRRAAVMWLPLGVLLLVHMSPYILTLAGFSRPWVLEAAGVELMLKVIRSVPGGAYGLWILCLLAGVAAFETCLAVFRRAESPVEPESCMWQDLLKGE